jgi:hypothetical protein
VDLFFPHKTYLKFKQKLKSLQKKEHLKKLNSTGRLEDNFLVKDNNQNKSQAKTHGITSLGLLFFSTLPLS